MENLINYKLLPAPYEIKLNQQNYIKIIPKHKT